MSGEEKKKREGPFLLRAYIFLHDNITDDVERCTSVANTVAQFGGGGIGSQQILARGESQGDSGVAMSTTDQQGDDGELLDLSEAERETRAREQVAIANTLRSTDTLGTTKLSLDRILHGSKSFVIKQQVVGALNLEEKK